MTKNDFISQVVKSAKVEISKKDAAALIDSVFTTVGKVVKKEENFKYPGFGSFVVRKRKARVGRNPRNGQEIQIKASKTVAFKPAAALKKGLN
jgi:nucleoid DNA-binding protein